MYATVYRNQSGARAVSLDGSNVVVPSGRLMALTDAWEETDEEVDPEELSANALERLAGLLEEQERRDAALACRQAEEARIRAVRLTDAERRRAAEEAALWRECAALLKLIKRLR